MPRIYQKVGLPAAPVFNFSANGQATIPENLRQKYDSYLRGAVVYNRTIGQDAED
jgi:hypothetical protein